MQLAFQYQLQTQATFKNFLVGKNKELLEQLTQIPLTQVGQCLYLYGASACGRSHLLQAVCHRVGQLDWPCAYVPLKQLKLDVADAEVFVGLETLKLLAVDDIDCIVGDNLWEEQLFDLFNRLMEHNVHLIMSGGKAIQELNVHLPDLRSRLQSALGYRVYPIADTDKKRLLLQWAEESALNLSTEVINYILHHCVRETAYLQKLLRLLETASLQKKCKVTIPLVKAVLEECTVSPKDTFKVRAS